MSRRVRAESARRLLELALAPDAVSPPSLVPGHGDMNEPLEEVALGGLGGAPGVLEHLVGGEVLAALDQRQAALEPDLEVRLRL